MFTCRECGGRFSLEQAIWRCPDCSGLLDFLHDIRFDPASLRGRPFSMWRYFESIPGGKGHPVVSLGEPITPLSGFYSDGVSVLLKLDYLFPTGSYKDRGAAVLVGWLRERGIRRIVEDSSGNAGTAIAAYAAKAGIACEIYVPDTTSPGKLHQIRAAGARVVRVPGGRQATADAALDAARDAFYASHARHPLFIHGTKTFAFEIWEQLGGEIPDAVVVPTGNGTLLLGAWIGFTELRKAGLTRGVPKLIAVQAEGFAPLLDACGTTIRPERPADRMGCLAEGIAIANPVRKMQMVEAIRESGGDVVVVNDEDIRNATRLLGRNGYFVEPTSAAGLAGWRKWNRTRAPSGCVVIPLTGTGLKCPDSVASLASLATDGVIE